jgi:hypothetical protein
VCRPSHYLPEWGGSGAEAGGVRQPQCYLPCKCCIMARSAATCYGRVCAGGRGPGWGWNRLSRILWRNLDCPRPGYSPNTLIKPRCRQRWHTSRFRRRARGGTPGGPPPPPPPPHVLCTGFALASASNGAFLTPLRPARHRRTTASSGSFCPASRARRCGPCVRPRSSATAAERARSSGPSESMCSTSEARRATHGYLITLRPYVESYVFALCPAGPVSSPRMRHLILLHV